MVNLIKVFAILFLVLPAYISANECQVSVIPTLTLSGKLEDTYKAVIINLGDVDTGNILLSSSDDIVSVEGLDTVKGGYETPGSIYVDGFYSFTYTVESGKTVSWSATCTASLSPRSKAKATKAPTAAPTHKATTTAKPKATTTTTTVKPKSTTTAKPKTTTTTAKPAATAAPAKSSTSTAKPSGSSTGQVCSGGSWWKPAPTTTWQWQLTGTIDTSVDVQMYDIDLFDNTAATISTLHSQGRVVICYFSTQYEDWRPDASDFTAAILGNGLDGWEGENYVDIRSTVVRNIMTARMDLAVTKGCDGLEPDNVDGYESDTGFPLTAADQLNFNEFIAAQAHARGLSVGLKNDVDQGKALEPFFDWALNEQCYEYSECATLSSFVTNGKAVFNTEYSGSAAKVCPYMVGIQFSSLIKTLDLTASIKAQCCTYAPGGCAAVAAHTCVTSESSLIADNAPTLETIDILEQEQEYTASATTTYASVLLVSVAVLLGLNL